jgi:hypothetical protein
MSVLNAINNRKIKEFNEVIEIVVDRHDPSIREEVHKANEVVQFFDKSQVYIDKIDMDGKNEEDDDSVVSVFVSRLADELDDDDDCSLDDFVKSKMYLDDAAADTANLMLS